MSAEFELLRFEASPVSATVAILELDGRFPAPAPARVRLLVERGGRGVEVPAVTSGGEKPWTASFAVALADAADARTDFSLVPGRGALVGLPAPEMAGGPDEDRYVALARQANELRHRLGEATAAADEAARLRSEIAAAEERIERAEAEAGAARRERDERQAETESARSEQSDLRDVLRATEARAGEAERDRASLRARAESAERAIAEQRTQAEAAEQRAREAEQRIVAAEDETRLARRDLRDTRARLESLLREHRRPVPDRHGHEVPDADEASEATAPAPSPSEVEPTAVLETSEIATALDDAPPAEPANTTRSTRIVRIDDPGTDEGEVLRPAAVGARYISPAETRPPLLTPARIMVGVAILLLVIALVAIALGAGIV